MKLTMENFISCVHAKSILCCTSLKEKYDPIPTSSEFFLVFKLNSSSKIVDWSMDLGVNVLSTCDQAFAKRET